MSLFNPCNIKAPHFGIKKYKTYWKKKTPEDGNVQKKGKSMWENDRSPYCIFAIKFAKALAAV